MEKNKIKAMGMKQIKVRREDRPGSPRWEQTQKSQRAALLYLGAGADDNINEQAGACYGA